MRGRWALHALQLQGFDGLPGVAPELGDAVPRRWSRRTRGGSIGDNMQHTELYAPLDGSKRSPAFIKQGLATPGAS